MRPQEQAWLGKSLVCMLHVRQGQGLVTKLFYGLWAGNIDNKGLISKLTK